MTTKGLVHDLDAWAALNPDRVAFRMAVTGEQITFGALAEASRRVAAGLAEHAPLQARIVVVMRPGIDYNISVWACLYAGMIVVPAYPPSGVRRRGGTGHLTNIVMDCQPRALLTTRRELAALEEELRSSPLPDVKILCVEDLGASEPVAEPRTGPLAVLQYTSGSTSRPKGVRVSHASLVANIAMIRRAMDVEQGSTNVSWLPPYHDMGLVGTSLGCVSWNCQSILLTPMQFLQEPALWLETIDRYRAAVSGGPNFAYDTCLERVADEQLERLDLSCWRLAYCGAEPIRVHTLERFAARFARARFSPDNYYPCYGLAEATLLVSASRGLRTLRVDRAAYQAGRAIAALEEGPRALVLSSSGRVSDENEIRIVDGNSGEVCAAESIGEIHVRGPNVSDGYWAAEQSAPKREVEGATYLATGDLGFVRDEHLFICGRAKEVLKLRGRTYHPHDIEAAAISAPSAGVRSAIALAQQHDGEESLAVLLVARPSEATPERLHAVAAAIVSAAGVVPGRLLVIRPSDVPRTTSGKLRRLRCAQLLEQGELRPLVEWTPRSHSAPRSIESVAFVAPRDDVERAIAKLWEGHLRVEPVGMDDNFFELGGDSLLAARVVAAVESQFGISLRANEVTGAESVARLAGLVWEKLSERVAGLSEQEAEAMLAALGTEPLPSAHAVSIERATAGAQSHE